MTDLTGPLTELRMAYEAFQDARKSVRKQILDKYKRRAEEEIYEAVQAEQHAIGTRVREMKERYGLTVNDIQDHVLRTRNWNTWKDIARWGDIAPESVIRANAKAERELASSPFEWSEDYTSFTVRKDPNGQDIEPITYPGIVAFRDGTLYPDAEAIFEVKKANMAQFRRNPGTWNEFLTAEIERQVEAGNLADPRLNN